MVETKDPSVQSFYIKHIWMVDSRHCGIKLENMPVQKKIHESVPRTVGSFSTFIKARSFLALYIWANFASRSTGVMKKESRGRSPDILNAFLLFLAKAITGFAWIWPCRWYIGLYNAVFTYPFANASVGIRLTEFYNMNHTRTSIQNFHRFQTWRLSNDSFEFSWLRNQLGRFFDATDQR